MKKCQPRSLTPYLDGELAADASQQVDEHLRGCPSCAALLDEVTSARERVRQMGRAIVPNTVLMPALEAFRERAGIGSAQQLSLVDIPVPVPSAEPPAVLLAEAPRLPAIEEPPVEAAPAPAVETPAVMEGYAPPAFPPLPDNPFADDYADAYTAAVVERPQPDAEAAAEAERIAAAEAAAEAERIAAEARAEAERIAAAEAAAEAERVAAAEAAAEAERMAAAEAAAEAERVAAAEAAAEAERMAAAEAAAEAERFAAEAAAEAERIAAVEAAAEAERIAAVEAADLLAAAAAAEAAEAVNAALGARPEAPQAPVPPPWLEAEAADAEDMEARGRVFVEEDLAAPAPEIVPPAPPAEEAHPEPVPTVLAPEFTGVPSHSGEGVEESIARMREELHAEEVAAHHGDFEPLRAALAATVASPDARSDAASGYREAIRARRERERPSGIGGLDRQVKIGLGAAAAIVLLLLVVVTAPRLFSRSAGQAAGKPVPSASLPALAAAPTKAPAAVPSSAPTAVAATNAPLSNVVTSGGTGAGYRAIRLRTGNPANGVYRLVFDLDGGAGGLPDAQLGRAADGSLYLQSTGFTVDPAVLATFGGVGPVSAIAATGSSTNLKFTISGQPQYSLYFLTGPNRLVIDLK